MSAGEVEKRATPSALPHGARLHKTGLDIPQGLTFEQWREVLRAVCVFDRTFRWALADVIFYGDGEYGSRYDEAIMMTGLSRDRLYKIVWVAGQFGPDRRRPGSSVLTFGHFEEIAKFDVPEQEYWLNQAEECEWTRDQLREAAHNTTSTRPPDRTKTSAGSGASARTSTSAPRPDQLIPVTVPMTEAERDRMLTAARYEGYNELRDWLRAKGNTAAAAVESKMGVGE